MTCTMLEGTDGSKMATSWGNIITVVDEPFDMFGKLMSLRDDLIVKYYTLCTDRTLEEIASIEKELAGGANPRDIKLSLANEIVTMYHTEKDASLAKNSWIETFSNGGVPDSIPEIRAQADELLADVLIANTIVTSKTDWRRLVEDKAVADTEGNLISDSKAKVGNATLKIGKKRFVKIIVE
jgi:tyrosyl-tRNA synthetase